MRDARERCVSSSKREVVSSEFATSVSLPHVAHMSGIAESLHGVEMRCEMRGNDASLHRSARWFRQNSSRPLAYRMFRLSSALQNRFMGSKLDAGCARTMRLFIEVRGGFVRIRHVR